MASLSTAFLVEPTPVYDRAPVQQSMDIDALRAMGPKKIRDLFASRGFKENAHLFEDHNITGSRLLLLTPADLREMGIVKVGDRLGIQQELSAMKSTARQVMRTAVIAEHTEVYPHNAITWCCHTCCGACPPQMDQYRLTSSQLKITHTHSPTICGKKCSCLGVRIENDYHPLNQMIDVDTTNMQDGCLAVKMTQVTCHLTPMSQGDAVGGRESASGWRPRPTSEMTVPFDEGERFAAQIRNQIEECKTNTSFLAA